jgi:hypothetical protein
MMHVSAQTWRSAVLLLTPPPSSWNSSWLPKVRLSHHMRLSSGPGCSLFLAWERQGGTRFVLQWRCGAVTLMGMLWPGMLGWTGEVVGPSVVADRWCVGNFTSSVFIGSTFPTATAKTVSLTDVVCYVTSWRLASLGTHSLPSFYPSPSTHPPLLMRTAMVTKCVHAACMDDDHLSPYLCGSTSIV